MSKAKTIKLLNIGLDRKIFEKDSDSYRRMVQYASLVQELHIIVFSLRKLKLKKIQIAKNAWAYPTNSLTKANYIFDAIKIGKNILFTSGEWVISSQDPFESALVALRLKKKTHSALNIQMHGDFFNSNFWEKESLLNRIRQRIGRGNLMKADSIRIVSDRNKSTLKRIGIDGRKIIQIPVQGKVSKGNRPIDKELKRKYADFSDIFLTVTRLSKEKNLEMMLRAFALVLKKTPQAVLLIAGSGQRETALKKLAKDLNLEKNIDFLGWVENPERLYKIADAFLLSSNHEGWPRSIIEAISSSLPVIMTDVGNAGQLVQNSKNGFVTPVGDAKAFALAIQNFLEDKALKRKFRKASHQIYLSYEKEVSTSLKLYQESWLLALENSRKKSILIAASNYPPEIGGSAYYAKNLEQGLLKNGHKVKTVVFSKYLGKLTGLRHFLYFLEVFKNLSNVEYLLVLDSFSAAFPALIAARLRRKISLLRVGGDFLWESYLDHGKLLALDKFYEEKPKLNLKEVLIKRVIRRNLKSASAILFNSLWQLKIWEKAYQIKSEKLFLLENLIDKKRLAKKPSKKLFFSAARDRKLKNLSRLELVAKKISDKNFHAVFKQCSYQEMLESLKNCYAAILPSISDISPDFAIKALSFNKPLILTKNNGLARDIQELSILIDPLDERDIEKAIRYLLNAKNYQAQVKKIKAFKRVREINDLVSDLEDIMKKIGK